MKSLFTITLLLFFVTDAFADDSRMRKFDLDNNQLITKSELLTAGCSVLFLKDESDSPTSNEFPEKHHNLKKINHLREIEQLLDEYLINKAY